MNEPPPHSPEIPSPLAYTDSVLTIDLDAIVANWRLLRTRAHGAEVAAVVKANGYGLGAAEVAHKLASAGCNLFFVAHIDEGLSLRRSFAGRPFAPEIAVLNGLPPGTEALFLEHRLTPVLNDDDAVRRWLGAAPMPHPASAILHVDSGINRLGMSLSSLRELAADEGFAAYPWRALMSHLACPETPAHEQNARQLALFRDAQSLLPGVPASLAASSGIFLGADYAFDLVRPGAALYGVNPLSTGPNPMRPVVALSARILQVRDVDRGMAVGYGAAHSMASSGRIATISLGYADGFPRSAGLVGAMSIGGFEAPVIGRISMDLITLDVSQIPQSVAVQGAMVDVLGAHRSVDDLARDSGTIGYEILTGIGDRYTRVYRGQA